MKQPFTLRQARWPQDRELVRHVRETVFVHEQHVPLALEWDRLDDDCLHLLAEDQSGNAIGTARLLSDGHIGRMAVVAPWRQHGIGAAMLNELVRIARERGWVEVVLNAQTHAVAFYARYGFIAEGPEFQDAGIPHCRMRRPLR